jgi:diketogulonate reductase-like aldo/keto reductase
LHNSLKNVRARGLNRRARLLMMCGQMGTSYVDLYLIHTPRAAGADIKSAWAQMEAAHAAGYVARRTAELPVIMASRRLCKSIGVSNFDERLLAELLEHAQVIPAVNQVRGCTP